MRLLHAHGQRGQWTSLWRPCRAAGCWQGRGWSEGGATLAVSPPPTAAAHPPLLGGLVLFGSTAAAGAEADTAQDGQQGGAPAQVERRAQLIPGDKTTQGVLAPGHGQVPPPGWGSHTHLVPGYKGSKKSRVMLEAYQVMATIPQQPSAGRELHWSPRPLGN